MREPKKFSAYHKTSGGAGGRSRRSEPEVGAGGLRINYYLFSTAYAFSVAVLRFLPYQTTITP